MVSSPEQCLSAVRDALRDGRRITVRSGGHCYEGFVSDNPGGVIIDVSGMRRVLATADGLLGLEGGCTNWDVYERLYKARGVTIPGGSCYSVGLGGYIVGGGYGLMSREFGLTVDYLAAVDVIVVNATGAAELVHAIGSEPARQVQVGLRAPGVPLRAGHGHARCAERPVLREPAGPAAD